MIYARMSHGLMARQDDAAMPLIIVIAWTALLALFPAWWTVKAMGPVFPISSPSIASPKVEPAHEPGRESAPASLPWSRL